MVHHDFISLLDRHVEVEKSIAAQLALVDL